MDSNQKKWEANREKVAFARSFPGLLNDARESVGRIVADVVEVSRPPGMRVVIFTDGAFLPIGTSEPLTPADLLATLSELRPRLIAYYEDAYRQLDALSDVDRELARRARLDNILGAIRANIGAMPELHERIPDLLRRLASEGAGCSIESENPPEGSDPSDS